jgi:thioredoxin 1
MSLEKEVMIMAMEFNKSNFESEVLQSDVPVLVDFWAPWCGPCKMIGPIVEELAGEFEGKAKVGKVNVDDNQELAGSFGIPGIPTVMLFKGGEVVNQFVGLRPKEDLVAALNDAM